MFGDQIFGGGYFSDAWRILSRLTNVIVATQSVDRVDRRVDSAQPEHTVTVEQPRRSVTFDG